MAPTLLFGILDYILFALMLILSVAVGVWFGVYGRKNNIKTVDYLMGGKTMGVFPVGVSLAASHISAITLMGAPAEIYIHGIQYVFVCVAAMLMALLMEKVYLPVFYDLQLTSTYEYLQLRFSQPVRLMASLIFTLQLVLFIPIVVYVPSLAFQQVSGADLHVVAVIVCIVCIFYTMLGGLKAVVWTDFLQAFVMVGALVAVMILGIIRVGGLGPIWEKNVSSGRLDVSFDPSPFTRNTFWSMAMGATVSWLSGCGTNQGTILKFLALPTRAHTRKAIVVFALGIVLMKLLSCYCGLIIYANYHDCDPLKTGAVGRPDQLLPYYVMDMAGNIPGLPGLFIAGVFSAALSSMSSCLNCLAGIIYEDFVAPLLRRRGGAKLSEVRVNFIMMAIVGVFGVICVALVFVVERLGAVLELGYSVSGITMGALLGLFTLGILFPSANSKGALAGSIASLLFMSWVVLGTQHASWDGRIYDPWFPTSTEGCTENFTLSDLAKKHAPLPPNEIEHPFLLYRLSYMFYCTTGVLVMLLVGLAVSFVADRFRGSKGPRRPRDERLFAPFVRRYFLSTPAPIPVPSGVAAEPSEKEHLAMNPKD